MAFPRAGTKRQQQQQQPPPLPPQSSILQDDSKYNKESSSIPHLTPHTLRLLKLIQEGTSDHAQLAAVHLCHVADQATSTPVVLWDILGRLQGYLTNPNWKTRQNASMAMEGIARKLPIMDQQNFLQQQQQQQQQQTTILSNSKNGTNDNQTTWLCLQDLLDHVSVILKHGRVMLSSSGTKYDNQEESVLQKLDATLQGNHEFVRHRIHLQRQILARRLGLSTILTSVGSGHDMATVLSDDDLLPPNVITSSEKKGSSTKKAKRINPPLSSLQLSNSLSIRHLLVGEIKKQHPPQGTDDANHNFVSHQSAQSLLATELVFRMFDASWYVRHGSLLGILALTRAWSVQQQSNSTTDFGMWPQDIMVRCLCVLALDRFGDYSETSTSSDVGGVVAPVREMAGQVFSTIYYMAPETLQRHACDILYTLATQRGEEVEWEIRHGALVAFKYLVAMLSNTVSTSQISSAWMHDFTERCLNIATMTLSDESDDVRGAAAQLFSELCADNTIFGNKSRRSEVLSAIVPPLWGALEKSTVFSTNTKDYVSLLSILIDIDFPTVIACLTDADANKNGSKCIMDILSRLLQSSLTSVKTSVVMAIGKVSRQLLYTSISESWSPLKNENRIDTAVSFCETVKAVFKLYSTHNVMQDMDNGDDHALFIEACRETWNSLIRLSNTILDDLDQMQTDLHKYLLMKYFGFTFDEHNSEIPSVILVNASFGQRHRVRKQTAEAVSSFLLGNELLLARELNMDSLEMCLLVCLRSPLVWHYEAACMLLETLSQKSCANLAKSLSVCRKFLEDALIQSVPCLKVDRNKVRSKHTTILRLLGASFKSGMTFLNDNPGCASAASETVLMLLAKTIPEFESLMESTDVSIDSMRITVLVAGALVAGGSEFLPQKLTPVVRSLMTSIRNEGDEDCQTTTCSTMANLLRLLSTGAVPERAQSFRTTRLKIFTNLCSMIKTNTSPGSNSAARVISALVEDLSEESSLLSIEPVWDNVSGILGSNPAGEDDLLILKAVCSGLQRRHIATLHIIDTFICPAARLHCTSVDAAVRHQTSKCIVLMCSKDEDYALKRVLPEIASYLKNDDGTTRTRGCQLLTDILDTVAMAICPFVRSLLPMAMSLMKDPEELCAKAAASIFSALVRLAPLVKKSVSLPLFEENADSNAELVMDHLIHGKPLPPCEIHPIVAGALNSGGITLRRYQLEGIAWLRFLQTVKLSGALTDAMGLGKTLQSLVGIALAHMDTNCNHSPKSLVVCPTSVVGHWMQEIERFFPGKAVFRSFSLTSKNRVNGEHFEVILHDYNIIVTSYSILRSEIDKLCGVKWHYCVLDEGHMLKNPKTATAQASRRLQAQHKLVLTGTPVQNRVEEVWATFDWLMPNFLGSLSQFGKDFAKPISKGQATGASADDVALGMEKLKHLHQQVLPFILRREKEQVLKELPPKCITTIPCDMSPIQTRWYQHLCSSKLAEDSLSALQRVLEGPCSPTDDPMPRLGSDALKVLLYLRLLCTHPALVDPEAKESADGKRLDSSGKLVALKELLSETGIQSQDIAAADNDSSLLYLNTDDDFDEGKDEIAEALEVATHSTVTDTSFGNSKCLIFAQFTNSLDIVEDVVVNKYFPAVQYLRLDGRVAPDKRAGIVDTFNNDKNVKILLLTTGIGGLGLNLTGADTVIFLEHDWNPHADLQAMDRAHRIGQTRTVNVYKLVTTDSIEEKIMKLQEAKLAISNAIVNSDNSSLHSMGTDRLLDIFRFQSEASKSTTNQIEEDSLDTLVEQYADEYRSLSLSEFIGGFMPSSNGKSDTATSS